MKSNVVTRLMMCAGAILIGLPVAHAGEKSLMHCFAFTPVKTATAGDWQAFFKASDELPKKIKGIKKVWYGKLQSPLSVPGVAALDQAATTKYRAGEAVPATVTRQVREYGMCMEMTDEAALKAYDTDAFHKTWNDAYAKVRVEGTTTFNILGQ